MIDLKTGKVEFNCPVKCEFHPFMTKEEFFQSELFNSEYLNRDNEFSLEDPIFHFNPLSIDGYEMYLTIHFGIRKARDTEELVSGKYVEIIELMLVDAYRLHDESHEKEKVYAIKQRQDEFLTEQIGIGQSDDAPENELHFYTEWGGISSNICLRYDLDIHIEIKYDNITEEDRQRVRNSRIPIF